MNRTDEQLKKSVVDHLFWDDSIDASRIKVQVSDCKAVLSGSVLTHNAKDSASATAWLVRGIQEVENLLRVRFPPGLPVLTDDEIQGNATHVLAWNGDVYGLAISVSVKNGVITMEGNVATYWQRNKIERIISDLLGVVDVINKLIVVPTEYLTDQAIAENIQTALKNTSSLSKTNIKVAVNEGKVTLIGSVATWRDNMDILATTANCRGVIAVCNEIKIRP
jgi:osmotically-inducible protein OsmY